MILIDIKRAVSEKRKVRFRFYRAKNLWYETEFGEMFPVPIDDTGDGTFLATDKAMYFMRHMQRHNAVVEEGNEANVD